MSPKGRSTAAGVDFAKLYAELGVGPDCGLDAFKRAYRRRVAELHPDRPSAAGGNPELLIALNLGHAAVLDFHRSQGRLPGSALPPSPSPPLSGSGQAATRYEDDPPRPATDQTSRRVPRMGVLLIPVVLLVAAIWRWLPSFEEPSAAVAARADVPDVPASAYSSVQLGMDRNTVAALIGEPVSGNAHDSHWIYGPSWIRFQCGRLADWYSSPLRPLGAITRTPAHEDLVRHSAESRPCPGRRDAHTDGDLHRLPGDS